MKQPGFFDVEGCLARLSGLKDQLTVDFVVFRPGLDKALAYADGHTGGGPPFDPVLMFKILMIQALNTLSDEQRNTNDEKADLRAARISEAERTNPRSCLTRTAMRARY